jgi:hypothetical protein
MFVLKSEYKELVKKLEVINRLWAEEKSQAERYKGLIEGKDEVISSLKDKVNRLEIEKKDLLNDLMISSGIRMSDQQKLMFDRQMKENGQSNDIDMNNQTRDWERKYMQDGLKKIDEKEAIRLMEAIEREMMEGGSNV